MKIYKDIYNEMISLENLFSAWDKFKIGKRRRADVQQFEWRLEDNIFKLHYDLKNKSYRHDAYSSFIIHDPKRRHIHKATVRDRVLHHAIFSKLNPLYEPTFIANSFSCRIDKGTHKGINILNNQLRQISGNGRKDCFALKCDIKKFFDTINQNILLGIMRKIIKDDNAVWLLREAIFSYSSKYSDIFNQKGVPIGNLTSQLFANVYMNEFDQFVKHGLKIKNYLRYTDDFVIVSGNRQYLEGLIDPIKSYLSGKLALELHPKKVTIDKFNQGIDFLGYVALPHHRMIRTKTRRRMFRKLRKQADKYKSGVISEDSLKQSLNSYLGVMSHADAYELSNEMKNQCWFWSND
jgi:retron-type reverse transcriptase